MRDPDRWTPSKYLQRGSRLVASRDPAEVGIGSRLVATKVSALYAKYLPRYARGRLADLGCGKVPLYGAYRGLVDAVTCVDWPASPHGALHVDIEANLGERLPFGDASFDTIILSDVLEHLPEPQRLWHEMARLLSPSGHALINVPFMYGIHEAPHDYFRYTEFALRRMALLAGLGVRVLEPVGGSLHVLADLLAKHLAHVPIVGGLAAGCVQGVVLAIDRFEWGSKLASTTGERFPLGYFMVVEKASAQPLGASP